MKPCGFKNCNEPARLAPVLVCPGDDPLKLELQLMVCIRHSRAPIAAYVSDEGWRHMKKMLTDAGRKVPPRSMISLEFETLSGLTIPHLRPVSPVE